MQKHDENLFIYMQIIHEAVCLNVHEIKYGYEKKSIGMPTMYYHV